MVVQEHINFDRVGEPLKKLRMGRKSIVIDTYGTIVNGEFDDLYDGVFIQYLKQHNIDYKLVDQTMTVYTCSVEYTGFKKDLIEMMKDKFDFDTEEMEYKLGEHIDESQNFERSDNPLDNLNIGKNYLDRKIIEETEWELPDDIINQNFDILGVVREYRGEPILVMKSKSDGDGDGKRFVAMSSDYRTDYYDNAKDAIGEIKGYLDARFKKIRDQIRPRHTNESVNFERTSDPLKNLGVGKRILIENWLKEYDLFACVINEDLTIDLKENEDTVIDLSRRDLTELPPFVQFRNVYGGFNISENFLTSLRGCPIKVSETKNYKGNFKCQHNKLQTLEFAPKRVDGAFICHTNPGKFLRTDVTKVCKVVGKAIWGDDKPEKRANETIDNSNSINKISIVNEKIDMEFRRDGNPLDKLNIGISKKIKDWMDSNGVVTSFDSYEINGKDGLIEVFGDINIVGMGLTELPIFINFGIIHGSFYATHNRFTSLRGFPKKIQGDLSIYTENKGVKIWKEDEIRASIYVTGTIWN